MWDAWAAYDDVAVGYVHNENATIVDADNNSIDEEDLHKFRKEAISYAAFRILKSRDRYDLRTLKLLIVFFTLIVEGIFEYVFSLL